MDEETITEKSLKEKYVALLDNIFSRLIHFLLIIGPMFPEWLLLRLAELLGVFTWLVAVGSRRVSRNTLQAINPDYTPGEIRRLTISHFTNQYKNLVELMRYSVLDTQTLLQKKVKIEGLIHVERALRKGKGIILVLPHFGNWELLGVSWVTKGYNLFVFYLDMRLKKVSDLLIRQRRRMNIGLIERSKLKLAIKLLKENAIIAAIADQDGGDAGVAVPFFGKKISFPAGTSGLHRMTGAVVLPNYLIRNSDDTYTFRVLPPIPMEKTRDKKRDEVINSCRIARVFEEIIRQDPGQWLLSYDRFKFRQHVEDLPELWRDIPESERS